MWSGHVFSIHPSPPSVKWEWRWSPSHGAVRVQWDDSSHRRRCLYCSYEESITSPVRNLKPLGTSHIVLSSTFTLIARGSHLLFFFVCCHKRFADSHHLYLCLRLTALIWSLPHFQVCVIMFSAPGFFPPSPLWTVHRVRKQAACSSSWSDSKMTWDFLQLIFPQQLLPHCLPETCVQGGFIFIVNV